MDSALSGVREGMSGLVLCASMKAITSIINVKEQSDIDLLLSGFQGELFTKEIKGLDDFELICFLVVR